MSPTEDIWSIPASRLCEIDILNPIYVLPNPFMDILAEWRNLGASHLFECTKEELAMNGGAASNAECAPSDPIVSHEIIWTLITKKLFNCASRTVSTRRQKGNPNQCRANGVKGTRGVKNFWSHPDSGQRLNSTLLHTSEALYMRSFTWREIGWLSLAARSCRRWKQTSLQSWRPRSDFEAQVASISRIAFQVSDRLADGDDDDEEDDEDKIRRKRLTKRASGRLYKYHMYSIVCTGNELFGRTTGSRSDTVVGQQFLDSYKIRLTYRDIAYSN